MQGMISGAYNFGKLALSTEAIHSIYHAKVQLLLILIETLDLEHLLQMIHDEITFRFSNLLIPFLLCISKIIMKVLILGLEEKISQNLNKGNIIDVK